MPTRHPKSGFTLIEIIVSLAIFSVVAVVALGALSKIVSANKKAQTLLSAVTNVNFAIESMSRDIRVGRSYKCQGTFSPTGATDSVCESPGIDSDVNGAATLSYLSSRSGGACNLKTAFRFNPNGGTWILERADQTDCAQDSYSDYVFYPILDPTVTITGYHLQITTDKYPIAFFRISGYVGVKEKDKTYFDVQTAVSARLSN